MPTDEKDLTETLVCPRCGLPRLRPRALLDRRSRTQSLSRIADAQERIANLQERIAISLEVIDSALTLDGKTVASLLDYLTDHLGDIGGRS